MEKTQFLVGQRVYVARLHRSHSLEKKQTFLGRVVTILSQRSTANDVRYFVRLAINDQRTVFLKAEYLEALHDQPLTYTDALHLRAATAAEVEKFDPTVVNRGRTPEELQALWETIAMADEFGYQSVSVRTETLKELLALAKIPAPNK